jgi:hypothetical protein
MTFLDALRDRNLFAPFFPAETWRPWFVCAAVLFGQTDGLSRDEVSLARKALGREVLPIVQAILAFLIVGRRGGKSKFSAALAVFLACMRRYTLSPGERGVGMVIAPNRRQARVIMKYIEALFDGVPMLNALVEHRTQDSIILTNGITIEVHAASYKSVRGFTVVFALIDEGAFLPTDESAEPDTELLNALRPAMSTVKGAMLVMISSPYARRGELWRAYREHFGRDGDPVIVWRADTRTMNPTVDETVIARAYLDDPASAAAEYGAEFRTDVENFLSREVIDAVVVPGRHELPHRSGINYVAFVDPSGGRAP